MSGFIKTFLMGILYVVLSPFILALLALFAVFCLIIFLVLGIRALIIFFAGGAPLGDLPEDVKAKKIIMERMQAQIAPEQSQETPQPQVNNTYTQNNIYVSPSQNNGNMQNPFSDFDVAHDQDQLNALKEAKVAGELENQDVKEIEADDVVDVKEGENK